MGDATKRTLYVGNLDSAVTEELVIALFTPIGPVKSCKIISEGTSDPYCFVEFADLHSAHMAINTMNKRQLFNKELKVNWATSPGASQVKIDTSKHFHIFVGDLCPKIENHTLRDAFAAFGEVSNCHIVRDNQTNKSKGYGFVSFIKKMEAENAIMAMNGQYLGSRNIRTNWATRKPQAPSLHAAGISKTMNYDEVFQQSSPTNCTVYCGGVSQGLTEELMNGSFSPYGIIQEIRVFRDKGYSFVRFTAKEEATSAIVGLNNTEINGQMVRCSWGKESGDPGHAPPGAVGLVGAPAPALPAGVPYPGYNSYPTAAPGYWYPAAAAPGYPAAAAPGYGGQFGYPQFGYPQGGGVMPDYRGAQPGGPEHCMPPQ